MKQPVLLCLPQLAEGDECEQSAHCFLFILSGTPAHGKMPLTVRVSLSASVYPIQTCPVVFLLDDCRSCQVVNITHHKWNRKTGSVLLTLINGGKVFFAWVSAL